MEMIERQIPHVAETPDITNVKEDFTDDFAREMVTHTFNNYSGWRNIALDRNWITADALMMGVVDKKFWKGTNVEKAAYPQPIVSDQFRSILPSLEQAVFPDNEDWFEVESLYGAPSPNAVPPQITRTIVSNLKGWLEQPCDIGKAPGRREVCNAFMDALLYKLGGVHVRFDGEKKRPVVEAINIKDIYLDPKAASPSADDNASIIWRKLMPIEDLKEYKDVKGFNIPEENILHGLGSMSPHSQPDATKDATASLSGVPVVNGPTVYNPGAEQKEIEVLIYYSKKRIIWVLNRIWVAYNEENPYKFIPFAFTPCYPLPHKQYGESIPDVLESTQRLSEGLMNNFLDTLHLAMNPPAVESNTDGNVNSDKWHPGGRIKVNGEAKDSIIFQPVPVNHVQPVWDAIQYLQQQGYSRTGTNPLQQGGIPTPSNANRTASGMSMQTQGGSNRLYAIVKQFEDYLLNPLLQKMIEMARIHITFNEEVMGFDEIGQMTPIKGGIFHIPIKITTKCASRVISKEALRNILPGILQYLLQGQLVAQIHQAGKTIDMNEVMQAIQDASGLGKKYSFIRDMSQQEIQMMMAQSKPQPDPNLVTKIQMESQAKMQLEQMKGQIDIQKEQIKNQPNPWELEMEKMKAQMDLQMKQVDIQMKQIELQLKVKESELKLVTEQMKLRNSSEKAQMDMTVQAQKHSMDLQMAQNANQQKLEHDAQMGDAKIEIARKQAEAKPRPKGGE